jgi:hypothetical protein
MIGSETFTSIAATRIASDFAKSSCAVVIRREMTCADGVRTSPLWLAFSARRRR